MEEQKFQELVLKQLEQLNQGQTTMQGDITKLRQSQARMEGDFGTKITTLFDAREVQQEVNQKIFASLDRLEAKVDVLQIETAYLKIIK